MKTSDWEKRQKHCNEVDAILFENGCEDSRKITKEWNGPKMWDLLEKKGHTAILFSSCKCSL